MTWEDSAYIIAKRCLGERLADDPEIMALAERYPVLLNPSQASCHSALGQIMEALYDANDPSTWDEVVRLDYHAIEYFLAWREQLRSMNEKRNYTEPTAEHSGCDGHFPYGRYGNLAYTRLAIVLEKQGRYDDAIEVAFRAQHEGWGSNWDARIKRL